MAVSSSPPLYCPGMSGQARQPWLRSSSLLCGALWVALPLGAGGGLLEAVQAQFDAGKYAEIATTLRAALPQDPQNGGLAFWLARSYFELSDFDDAVVYAERAVKLQPADSEYHQWLGRAYAFKARRVHSFLLARKGREEFIEAVRLNSRNILARGDLMNFYLEAPWIVGGSKEKAWQEAETIAALDKVEGHLARAAYWRSVHQPDRAEAEYHRVLDLKPQRIEPYLEVADFDEEREDAQRMKEVVAAASGVSPGDRRLIYYRGVACVLAGARLLEAEHFLKSYLATVPPRSDFPSHASAREWLGRLYEGWGKTPQAAEQYRLALQLDPDRSVARERLRRIEAGP